MTLLERLALLESDLDVMAALWRQEVPEVLSLQDSAMHERISARFHWVSLQAEDGRILARNDPGAQPFLLTTDERKHLAGNKTVVATRKESGGLPMIVLARSAFSGSGEKRIPVGRGVSYPR
jgi:hypothetical protein